jgi:hypothetical protein
MQDRQTPCLRRSCKVTFQKTGPQNSRQESCHFCDITPWFTKSHSAPGRCLKIEDQLPQDARRLLATAHGFYFCTGSREHACRCWHSCRPCKTSPYHDRFLAISSSTSPASVSVSAELREADGQKTGSACWVQHLGLRHLNTSGPRGLG